MKRKIMVIGFVVFLVACGVTATKIVTTNLKPQKPIAQGTALATASADYTGYCGQELADVKQLRDSGAGQINFTPVVSSIADLQKLNNGKPNPVVTRNADERKVVTINVHLDKMKGEADSDIHVGVSDGNGNTMIVEFVAPQCEGSLKANEMTQARADLFSECGTPVGSTFTNFSGQSATVTGVVFFDKIHGQYDVASNGVELHPVLSFKGCSGQPAPPVISTATTTVSGTTTVVTTSPVDNSGAGCKKYPNHHWYAHIFHKNCKSYFYTTP